MVCFKERNLRVHFKYEHLPIFCFMCGRIGHGLKECETVGELGEKGFKGLDEHDLSFGLCLRACLLPKMIEEPRKKDSSSSNCNKHFFNNSTIQSRYENKEMEKYGFEVEVEQVIGKTIIEEGSPRGKVNNSKKNFLEIETVAESFGTVDISNKGKDGAAGTKDTTTKRRKWTRRKGVRKYEATPIRHKELEIGKRQLVDVTITEGNMEDCGRNDKKRKQIKEEGVSRIELELVLEDQYCLDQ